MRPAAKARPSASRQDLQLDRRAREPLPAAERCALATGARHPRLATRPATRIPRIPARAATRRPRQPSAARRRRPNHRPALVPPPTCATATRAGATRARRTAVVTARAVPMCAPSPANATVMRAGATRARRIAAPTAPVGAPRSRPQRQRLSTRAPTSIVGRAGRRFMMRAASRIVQVSYKDCRRGGVDFSNGSRDGDNSVEGVCVQLAAIFYIEFDKLIIGRVDHFS